MSNFIQFLPPVSTECSGSTMPGLTSLELRNRAMQNFYTAERHRGVDAATAYDHMISFGEDLDRIASRLEMAHG